jgi:hypothetical protein
MTRMGRLFGEIFLSSNASRVKDVWIRVAMSVMRRVGNQVRGFAKSRHLCCAVNGHSLIVFGSPSRFNYTQSAAGLP